MRLTLVTRSLLVSSNEARMKTMNEYKKQQCDKIVSRASLMSALVTCNPVPGGDTLLVLLVQMWMIKKLFQVCGIQSYKYNSLNLLSELATKRLGMYGANEILNVLPIGIPMANSIVSYYITNKIGWEAVENLEGQLMKG